MSGPSRHSPNLAQIEGALRFDPRTNQTARGQSVTNMIVNVPTGRGDNTTQIRVVAWGNDVGDLPELHQGDFVRVSGRLSSSAYENKEGVKVEKTEVVAESVEHVRHKSATVPRTSTTTTRPPAGRAAPPPSQPSPDDGGDDIPF